MSERPKLNSANSFCWIELACSDMPNAKDFYGTVMGWKFKDNKASGGVYSNIQLGSKGLVGGLYEFSLPDEKPKKGSKKDLHVPAFWGSYIATKDIKSTTEKALKLGGSLIAEISDLGDTGYISVIQDPAGAMFGLWQAKKLPGFGPDREDLGASGWNELHTDQEKVSVAFYSKLFNWKAEKQTFNKQSYITFTSNKKRVAGLTALTPKLGLLPPHWLNYFNVKDCDHSTKLAIMKGAKVLHKPTTVKGAGRMSILSDAQDAVFALMQYDPELV